MGTIKDRMDILFEEHLVSLAKTLEYEKDPKLSRNGRLDPPIARDNRFLAVCYFYLHKDKNEFFNRITDTARRHFTMFERKEKGEKIDPSVSGILQFQEFFDILACGDLKLALRFSEYLGKDEKEERGHGFHPLYFHFGFSLKYVFEKKFKQAEPMVKKFHELCEKTKKGEKYLIGYANLFQAIIDKDSEGVQAGFDELLAGHKKLCKGTAMFSDSADEAIFIWGIGIINMCEYLGYKIKYNDPLIPDELVIGLK